MLKLGRAIEVIKPAVVKRYSRENVNCEICAFYGRNSGARNTTRNVNSKQIQNWKIQLTQTDLR